MKKYFLIIILLLVVFITGCGKVNKEKLISSFISETENLKGYYMEGVLSINNNDDNYEYDVKVSYQNPDYYKVILLNKSNNYEQVILRNADGVYVVNPSLNKSFRFQSEWPYNNSQSYLLQSIATDLKADKDYEFNQKDEDYQFIVKVTYPNNRDIVKEKITIDQTSTLKMVEILDNNNIARITFKVTALDKKATFKESYFALDAIISKDEEKKESDETKTTTTNKIDDALFPLYLPTNTSLSSRETITTDVGERIIMTFAGDSSFILVQENVAKEEELTVIPSYGEPYLLIDTVGALTDTSYTWISNGIEYYIVSDVMAQNELLEVAKSINIIATIGEK